MKRKTLRPLSQRIAPRSLAFALTMLAISGPAEAADLGFTNGIVEASIRNLESGGAKIQKRTLLVLGEMGNEADKAVPEITKILVNGTDDTIVYALRALGKIGTLDALLEMERYARSNLPRLIDDLMNGNNPLGQTAASKILGELGSYALDAAPFLLELAFGSDLAVGKHAQQALEQILKASGVKTTFGYKQDLGRFLDQNKRLAEDQFGNLKRSLR